MTVPIESPTSSEATPNPEPDDTGARTAPSDRGRGRTWLIAGWVLSALALTTALLATWQWRTLAERESTRDAAGAVTADFLVTLTNWDATQGLEGTRDQLREAGTDDFVAEVDRLFGDTEDLAGLEEIGAQSDGVVQDLFVQRIENEQAEVFAVVVQRVSTDSSDEAERTDRFARVTLAPGDSGEWQVDDVDLIADVAEAPEAPAVPGSEQPPTEEDGS